MFSVLPLLLIVTCFINVLMGLMVLFGAAKSLTNKLFFLFSVSVATWCAGIAGFLASDTINAAHQWAVVFYTAGLMIGFTLLLFSFQFAYQNLSKLKIGLAFLLMITAGCLYFILSGTLINNVTISEYGNTAQLNNFPYVYYAAVLSVSIYAAAVTLTAHLRTMRESRLASRRGQLRILTVGLWIAANFGLFFNVLLPGLGNYELIWLGPLFSAFLVGAVFLAVIRHGLFDVRQAIARTIAYIMLIALLAVFYGVMLFTLSELLFGTKGSSVDEKWLSIALAVFISFTYQPLKRFVDKTTDKYFYRDAYDPQEVLDSIGKVIVDEIDTKKLSNKVAKLLQASIKPSYVEIIIRQDHSFIHSFRGNGNRHDVGVIEQLQRDKRIVALDGFSANSEGNRISDIYAACRLQTAKNLVGYILLGEKASGSSYSDQDVGLLSVVSDELAVAAENGTRFKQIQDFSDTLQDKINEATLELKQSNKKLHDLDASKDEFISMASHQLRTPLTSIKGYISMVLDGDAGDITPMQRKLLEEAFSSSQRMVYLIGDFLNVSRLQTGKFMLESAEVDVTRVVGEEIDQLSPTAAARQITLKYDRPSTAIVATVDENKIRQVVMNLIDNAIYYTRTASTIRIELHSVADELVFKVHDQGIGVPAGERHQLFSKFYRASNARKVRPDGTGIGLFMAKKVVIAHRGSVIFETKEGKGSTFGFRLPIKKSAE